MRREIIKSGDASIALDFYGNQSCQKIVLFCHGFPGTNRLPEIKKHLPKSLTFIELHYHGNKAATGIFSFLNAMKDVKNAAHYLRTTYKPKYLHALGYSYGGLYTLNVAHREPQLFTSLILLAPVINSYYSENPTMQELWQYTRKNKIIRFHDAAFYKTENALLQKDYNPLDFAPKIQTPTTILHGDQDITVPISDFLYFFEKLESKKKFVLLKDKTHDLTGNEKELLTILKHL